MVRQLHKLSPRTVATIKTPGRHSDGGGLYLVVSDPPPSPPAPEGTPGAKRWVFMFRWNGKNKEMGLGGLSSVPMPKAREKARAARELLAEGINPIEAKRATVEVPEFGDFADNMVAGLKSQWRNPKHIKQWETTFKVYTKDLRPLPVDRVNTEAVLSVLQPLWAILPETASRVRGRIERVLDAAKAKGFRTGENPARWRGHLDHLLPKRQKLTRGHHAALPLADLPDFLAKLHQREAMAALALEFTILTAARTGETLGATWAEVDLERRVWTVPASRMKAGREHRVPLSARVLEILSECAKARTEGNYLFPGHKAGSPLSGMSMAMLLRRMGVANATTHGFRSTFRDWAGEASNFPREVVEAALAHSVGDATERAYRRGDALEKRRKLMEAWARACHARPSGEVLPMVRPA